MGFFDKLINAFSKLFGDAPREKFDDNAILVLIRALPQSFPDNYKKAIMEIADNIHQVYETANNKEFTIGVIGDFTVGKSTFVNSILGDRILPVSANPTTAIITKIKYGNKPGVVVRYKDGSVEEMTYETYMNFSAFSLNDFQQRMSEGDIQRFKNVIDAVMFVRSEFLKKNNLCIVDTLGLSAHEIDNSRTIASIRDSIATIYLCSERGLSDKDIHFMSKYLNPEKNDLFICINRIDLVRRNERDVLSQLVKLKIDDILRKKESTKTFPPNRIYQVSSLYQEFANGFTDHENWREGVNYQEHSGFVQIMNDVGEHVKANAIVSRKVAINRQLQKSQAQVSELLKLRELELDGHIVANTSKMNDLKTEIKDNQEKIFSVNLQFEKLFNEVCSFSNTLYSDFSQSVNKAWEEALKKSLVNQVTFGVGDYLALERDILSLKLNIFKSMTDYRYAKLKSLSSFVDLTTQFLKEKLRPITEQLELQIKCSIEVFIEENHFDDFFDNEMSFENSISYSVKQDDVVYSIYRAVALAATESTWVSNSNRRIKMLNAAKNESLKSIEKPMRDRINQFYSSLQKYLKDCNTKAIESNVKIISRLTQQVKVLEQQNASIREQLSKEKSYFKSIIDLLNNSTYEECAN